MQSLVSVIIRAYNNENTILRSVRSALNQDYLNVEILIINDGSTDDTIKNLNSITDSKMRIYSQKHSGAIDAAFNGMGHASGEFLTFLDADDELLPGAIKYLSEPLKDDNYGFSYCDYWEIYSDTDERIYISLTNFFNIMACGVMFKRIVIEKLGFWDKCFILPEYDFIFRVKKEYQGKHIQRPLYRYYRHSNSMTADQNLVLKAKEQIFKKYGIIDGFKEY